jgi:hypothetical protein
MKQITIAMIGILGVMLIILGSISGADETGSTGSTGSGIPSDLKQLTAKQVNGLSADKLDKEIMQKSDGVQKVKELWPNLSPEKQEYLAQHDFDKMKSSFGEGGNRMNDYFSKKMGVEVNGMDKAKDGTLSYDGNKVALKDGASFDVKDIPKGTKSIGINGGTVTFETDRGTLITDKGSVSSHLSKGVADVTFSDGRVITPEMNSPDQSVYIYKSGDNGNGEIIYPVGKGAGFTTYDEIFGNQVHITSESGKGYAVLGEGKYSISSGVDLETNEIKVKGSATNVFLGDSVPPKGSANYVRFYYDTEGTPTLNLASIRGSYNDVEILNNFRAGSNNPEVNVNGPSIVTNGDRKDIYEYNPAVGKIDHIIEWDLRKNVAVPNVNINSPTDRITMGGITNAVADNPVVKVYNNAVSTPLKAVGGFVTGIFQGLTSGGKQVATAFSSKNTDEYKYCTEEDCQPRVLTIGGTEP